jgi:hypothetical protein
MKKGWVFVLLVIGLVSLGILFGCGSSTSTDTTTTTTTTTTLGPSSAPASAVGTGASVANTALLGVANVGTAVGNSSAITGDPSKTSSSSVLSALTSAFTTIPVAPPSSFFDVKDSSWNGYLVVPSLHTGEVVSIRFSTMGGIVIDGLIFATPSQKKIADVPGINWDDLVDPSKIFPTGIASIGAWATGPTQTYQNINSMWDYIMWSSVLPQVRQYAITQGAPPTMALFATPASTLPDDMVGAFQGTVTREASTTNYGVNLSFLGTMEYATYIDPAHEVPKSLTGEGTVTLPDGTAVALTMSLGFVTNESGGIIPSRGTMDWSFTLSAEVWSGTATLNGGDRTASGNVKKNGVEVGTLYLNASGGAIVTIEGVTYNITNPL